MSERDTAIVEGREERRAFDVTELRALRAGEDEDSPTVLEGYAAVFDEETDVLWWREKIARGAFDRAVSGEDDVRALWNHDSSIVLGRNGAGTLSLEQDERGLKVRIHPDMDSPEIASKVRMIQRGDVSQMSFGFRVLDEDVDSSQEPELRTLRAVQLHDVSPVTYPAYPTTTVEARSRMEAARAPSMPREVAERRVALAERELS